MGNEDNNLVETLKSRGLSCGKLKSMENRERRDASEFRRVGFNKLADVQEGTANQLKSLREKVCKLR